MDAIVEYALTHIPEITIGIISLAVVFWAAWHLRGIKESNAATESALTEHLNECSEKSETVNARLEAIEKQNHGQDVKLDILLKHFKCVPKDD